MPLNPLISLALFLLAERYTYYAAGVFQHLLHGIKDLVTAHACQGRLSFFGKSRLAHSFRGARVVLQAVVLDKVCVASGDERTR